MSFILTLLAPVIGTFVYGFERVLKAKMQRRIGPPILQPFYDMFKLFDKRSAMIHPLHVILAIAHFITLWASIGMIFYGSNLLYVIFLHLLSTLFIILAGFSVRSIYSHIGANRELLALVAYEPILLMIASGFYISHNTFDISVIFQSESLLRELSLLFIALLIILPLKLKRSPFDGADAHQEIVGGVEIEYSGAFYEILYMSKVTEIVFVYSLVYLFGGNSIILGAILVVGAFLLVNLVDNSTARVRMDHTLKIIYLSAFILSVINLVWIA